MLKLKKIASIALSLAVLLTSAVPFTALAASESEIRSKIVSVASNEVGYKGTSSYSKYGEWYGYQGSWCTTFVLWCYNKAGSSLGTTLYGGGVTPTGGNCNSMISWYTNKGRYHKRGDGYKPKKGDLVFFDWSGNGSSQHVGIVNYISGSTVYTIEGNCSGQVKARSYTTSGSKPYNNVSAIMGYASPAFSGASGSSAKTTAKKTTKKATTKKKTTTTRSSSPKKTTSKTKTTKKNGTSTAKTTTATTAATSATQPKKVEKLTLSAENQDMMVGDTVKLGYSIEPSDTKAVVGYFCDEEGIIEIDNQGDITAVGAGTATVVVCVNDELYSQCSFNVTKAVAEVTTYEQSVTEEESTNARTVFTTTQRNAKSVLTSIGVNVDTLSQNKAQYIIPISIAVLTIIISIIVSKNKKRKKN